MNALSLFSGIGGLDLAGEWAGVNTVAMCEREPYPRRVLAKHWPGVPIYDDVCTLTREVLERDGIDPDTIGLISAGFPCQPFSHAGNRAGTDDERYLWPEVVRVVDDIRPTWFVGENVTGLLSMANEDGEPELVSRTLDRTAEEDFYEGVFTQSEIMLIYRICQDLEDIGYAVQIYVVPAAAVGAVHQRYRVFIVGNTERSGRKKESRWRAEPKPPDGYTQLESGVLGNASSKGLPQRGRPGGTEGTTETGTGLVEQPERSGSDVANTAGERCREARCDCKRSAKRTTGSGTLANSNQQHGDYGGHDTSQACGEWADTADLSRCKALADSCCPRRQECDAAAIADRPGHSTWRGDEDGIGRAAKPGMGRSHDELSAKLDGGLNSLDELTDFIASYPQPAPMGCEQYDWEPSRVAQGVPERTAQLKAYGNAVDPLQIYPILYAIKYIDDQLQLSI